MKKLLLLFGALALCGCSVNEAEPPIEASKVKLDLNDDYTNFNVTIPEFEAMLNYQFSENNSDFEESKFKEDNDKYIFDYDDSISIGAKIDSNNFVNFISITQSMENGDYELSEEIGSISNSVMHGLFLGNDQSTLLQKTNEMLEDCKTDNNMHGSAVNDNILSTIDFTYKDDSATFVLTYEPTKYVYDAEYKKSNDFADFTQTYCPSYTVEGQQETEESQDATKTEENQEQPAKQTTYYGPGMYKVGVDIPAGEYNVKAEIGELGYLEVSSDPNGTSIITNDAFENNSYVSISDGQYLKLESCYISQ